ncbi:Hypothetical predicted protein [Pelobates cultripes]|nr:Hypothetical predicted protein [Pelobates cultripes]
MDGTLDENTKIIPQNTYKIDFIEDPDSFSYNNFFQNYLVTNNPCLFSAKFTENWGSRKDWVTDSNSPNWHHLLQNFGDAIVPVANCDVKEYNSNPKEQIPLREYITYWRNYIKNNHLSANGCLYLKDWHMHRAFPNQDAYRAPQYFSSDWLNEYWDAIAGDDYRFVYMGPTGSWTPFHADVFRSYSWSANICGRKKWLLFPPGQEDYLRDHRGNLPYDVTSTVLQDQSLYPKSYMCCPPIEVVQEAGQVIFIPSGWHHQVYNLADTISINHNWVNGCNVSVMWRFLRNELEAVHQEIGEWKETMDNWHDHCQVIMKSCTGIDYKEFYIFLKIIAENRIYDLENSEFDSACEKLSNGSFVMSPGPQHAMFDITKIIEILTFFMCDEDFQKLEQDSLSPPPDELMRCLKSAIAKHSLDTNKSSPEI